LTVNALLSFEGILKSVGGVLLAIGILLAMITIHEFGHYIFGKLLNFKINEFSIGFGPAIFKRENKEGEVFAIRLIPLGGYCAFEGEDDDAVKEGDFNSKKPWQRILVLIAGATMNFLTAILVVCIFFGAYGCPVYKVVDSAPNADGKYVAMQGPLEEGDIILSVDGKNVYMITDFMSAIEDKDAGDIIKVKLYSWVYDSTGVVQRREIHSFS
jgi:regulator of sigma E protease